jgi:hypothetical protein
MATTDRHYLEPAPRYTEAPRPGEDQKKGSAKLDANKCPLEQGVFAYFPRALLAVGWVSEYGSRKYAWGGQGSVPEAVTRYGNAKARHALKPFIEGPYDDGDSGLAHLAQDAWCALAKLDRAIKDGELEIRRGNDIETDAFNIRRPVLGTARKVEL